MPEPIAHDATRPVVAVTGASGFVGTWLVARLKERAAGTGVEIVPFFDAPPPSEGDKRGADIRDAEAVAEVVGRLRPKAIVHLAAVAAPAEVRRDARHAWNINLLGTFNLADAILSNSPGTRLIFTSSSEVYGESFRAVADPITEDALLLPTSAYGATKAAADVMLAQMARDGLRCVRFRPFNHTGPGQSESYVVPAFARQVARIEKGLQEPVITVGNLEVERDFLDVRDVVDAYAEAALGAPDLEAGAVFNLASGIPRPISAILGGLLALSSERIAVEVNQASLRKGEIPLVRGDASRAASSLGWKPKIAFEQTIEAVLEDWRRRV